MTEAYFKLNLFAFYLMFVYKRGCGQEKYLRGGGGGACWL